MKSIISTVILSLFIISVPKAEQLDPSTVMYVYKLKGNIGIDFRLNDHPSITYGGQTGTIFRIECSSWEEVGQYTSLLLTAFTTGMKIKAYTNDEIQGSRIMVNHIMLTN